MLWMLGKRSRQRIHHCGWQQLRLRGESAFAECSQCIVNGVSCARHETGDGEGRCAADLPGPRLWGQQVSLALSDAVSGRAGLPRGRAGPAGLWRERQAHHAVHSGAVGSPMRGADGGAERTGQEEGSQGDGRREQPGRLRRAGVGVGAQGSHRVGHSPQRSGEIRKWHARG
eukprot:scaffold1747_cov251-Pinguiococcus_pyrenoidosus.AAC.14